MFIRGKGKKRKLHQRVKLLKKSLNYELKECVQGYLAAVEDIAFD